MDYDLPYGRFFYGLKGGENKYGTQRISSNKRAGRKPT